MNAVCVHTAEKQQVGGMRSKKNLDTAIWGMSASLSNHGVENVELTNDKKTDEHSIRRHMEAYA